MIAPFPSIKVPMNLYLARENSSTCHPRHPDRSQLHSQQQHRRVFLTGPRPASTADECIRYLATLSPLNQTSCLAQTTRPSTIACVDDCLQTRRQLRRTEGSNATARKWSLSSFPLVARITIKCLARYSPTRRPFSPICLSSSCVNEKQNPPFLLPSPCFNRFSSTDFRYHLMRESAALRGTSSQVAL